MPEPAKTAVGVVGGVRVGPIQGTFAVGSCLCQSVALTAIPNALMAGFFLQTQLGD